MLVDVIMIIGANRIAKREVLESLNEQGIPFNFYVQRDTLRLSSKIENIVHTRNIAKHLGNSPFVMWVDDDMVLPKEGIKLCLQFLLSHPNFGAVGINGQKPVTFNPFRNHIGMASILVYRNLLDEITFRFERETKWCECMCFCDDLRKKNFLVDYLPGLRATHLTIVN